MLRKPPALTEGPGGIIDSAKFARHVYHQVFENIGGIELLTQLARENPRWFLDKHFVKTVQPEKVEVQRDKTVAEILAELDAKMGAVRQIEGEIIDVEASRVQTETPENDD